MRFNELAIENAVLETEIVKSLRKLQERNRLDEIAQLFAWIQGAVAWAVRAAAVGGAAWITEDAVNRFFTRLAESNFRPDADFMPRGTQVVFEDETTGDRHTLRYNGTHWERPRMRPNPSGTGLIATNNWSKVPDSFNMSRVLESAATQRPGLISRVFGGRNAFSGLGFDFRNVSQDDWARSVNFTNTARSSVATDAKYDDLRRKYRGLGERDSSALIQARQSFYQRTNTGFWAGIFVNLGIGLGGLYRMVNELNEAYKIQVREGTITLEEYNQLVQELQNSIKSLIATAILGLSAPAAVSLAVSLLTRFFPKWKAAKGWPARITAAVFAGVVAAALYNDSIKQILIDFLSDSFLIVEDTWIDNLFTEAADSLMAALGIQDLMQDTIDQWREGGTNFEPSDSPPSFTDNDPRAWGFGRN
jgi:hypothetical protein